MAVRKWHPNLWRVGKAYDGYLVVTRGGTLLYAEAAKIRDEYNELLDY